MRRGQVRSAEVRGCGESLSRSQRFRCDCARFRSRRGEEGVEKVPVSPRPRVFFLTCSWSPSAFSHALTPSLLPLLPESSLCLRVPVSARPRVLFPVPSRLVRVTNFGNLVGNIADGIGHFSSSENEIHVGGALFEEGEYLILSN